MQEQTLLKLDIEQVKRSFSQLVDSLSMCQWRSAITSAKKKYNIKIYNIDKISPKKVKNMYETMVDKFYVDKVLKPVWYENELRIYIWVIVCLGVYWNKQLDDFTRPDWELLSKIFLGKTPELCQFQYNSLKNLSIKIDRWSPAEDEMLTQIISNLSNKNKWNKIAKEIFLQSDKKYFRSAKQCRERWNNYLNPHVHRGEWTLQEDNIMVSYIIKHGKKWACVAKALPKERTEHMVKNRYKTLYIKFRKDDTLKKGLQQIELLKLLQKKISNEIQFEELKGKTNQALATRANRDDLFQQEDQEVEFQVYGIGTDNSQQQSSNSQENDNSPSLNHNVQVSQDYEKQELVCEILDEKVTKPQNTAQNTSDTQVYYSYEMQDKEQLADYFRFDYLLE